MAVYHQMQAQLNTTASGLVPPPQSSTSTMIRRHRAIACCWALLSWLSFFVIFASAQSQPDSVVTSFSNLPAQLFFFDDTDVSIIVFGVRGA